MLSKCVPRESLRQAGQKGLAWVVEPSMLAIGDVLVSTGDNLISLGVRVATRSSVSHAAIHVGGGFIVEAVDGGVRRVHVRSLVFPNENFVHVLRPREASEAQLLLASEYARSLVYRPYSTRGAVAAVAPFCRASQDPGRFCSQVVSEALQRAGVPHVDKAPEEATPGDLMGSKLFTRVEQAKRGAQKSAIMHALSEMQPTWALPRGIGIGQVRAEQFEELARSAAEEAMRNHSCYSQPYHFFDALRQMAAVAGTHRKAAEEVDAVIMEKIHEYGAALGDGVEPRSTIPGVVTATPDPDLIRMFDAHDDTEANEVERLNSELLAGREWDESEWRRSIDEINEKHKETSLPSLLGTQFWLLGDFGRVEATYQWLAMEN